MRAWRAPLLGFVTLLSAAGFLNPLGFTQTHRSAALQGEKPRAVVLFSHALPRLDGDHVKTTMVEVNYGPGESSTPHRHPCAVIGYVTHGLIRTQVKGQSEIILKAGDSFYEAPDAVHLISANGSLTEPASFLATFICDHDAPLSSDVLPNGIHSGNK